MKKNIVTPTTEKMIADYTKQFNTELQMDLAVTFTPHGMYTPAGTYELDPSVYETFKRCIDYTLQYYNANNIKTNMDLTMITESTNTLWSTVWTPFMNSLYSNVYTWTTNVFHFMLDYMKDHGFDMCDYTQIAAIFDSHKISNYEDFNSDNDMRYTFFNLVKRRANTDFYEELYYKFAPVIEMRVFNIMLDNYNAVRGALSDILITVDAMNDTEIVSEIINAIDIGFNGLMRNTVTEAAIFIKNVEALANSVESINEITPDFARQYHPMITECDE